MQSVVEKAHTLIVTSHAHFNVQINPDVGCDCSLLPVIFSIYNISTNVLKAVLFYLHKSD